MLFYYFNVDVNKNKNNTKNEWEITRKIKLKVNNLHDCNKQQHLKDIAVFSFTRYAIFSSNVLKMFSPRNLIFFFSDRGPTI